MWDWATEIRRSQMRRKLLQESGLKALIDAIFQEEVSSINPRTFRPIVRHLRRHAQDVYFAFKLSSLIPLDDADLLITILQGQGILSVKTSKSWVQVNSQDIRLLKSIVGGKSSHHG